MLAVPKFSFPPLYPQKRSQNCGVLGSIVASCFGNFGILGKVRTEEEKKERKRKKKGGGWSGRRKWRCGASGERWRERKEEYSKSNGFFFLIRRKKEGEGKGREGRTRGQDRRASHDRPRSTCQYQTEKGGFQSWFNDGFPMSDRHRNKPTRKR